MYVAGECDLSPAGTAMLREAVEILSRAPTLLVRARALIALGARLRRERQTREAREVLKRGLDLAHSCGAVVVATRAAMNSWRRAESLAATHSSGQAALTGRELRVVELVLDGLTNRQIARALFLSPRTVEHHLRNAYRKLAVSSREELSEALAADRDRTA